MTPTPPEHNFMSSVDVWELAVFNSAKLFTVIEGRSPFNRTRSEFKTWPEARAFAEGRPQAMVYAVAGTGRQVMLVRSRWGEYQQWWDKYHSKSKRRT